MTRQQPEFTDGPVFTDGKDADALRTIGEVSAALGIKQHVLRYWEQSFPLLQPLKRNGGRRYYRPEDIQLLMAIDRLLNQEGYTIKGAEQYLRTQPEQGKEKMPSPPAPSSSDAPPVQTDGLTSVKHTMPVAEISTRLKAIHARLAAVIDK